MGDIRFRILDNEAYERLKNLDPKIALGPDKYCPTCNKTGEYRWAGSSVECDCAEQLALYKHYLWAGIGGTYQRLDWHDYDGDEDTLKLVGAYVLGHQDYVKRGMGLYFWGPYGSGKTMLANLALKEMVKAGYDCFATTYDQTIEMFTAGWYSYDEKRYFKDRFIGSEILLLDDVGQERTDKLALSETTFKNIVRTRVQHARPTFITSNLGPDSLRRVYGGAALSLVRELSIECPVDGQDYRERSHARNQEETDRKETRPIV